jgi:putative hydrolase
MRLRADLHTHTVSSGHAYSTVTEMAAGAAARGIELIGVTDHGPGCPGGAHPYHFWNLKAVPPFIEGVRILKGVEANIVGEDGTLDLEDEILRVLDFVAVGFHPACGFDDSDAATNTAALVGAIGNPLVDMVTHPGNVNYPLEIEPVVAAAVAHGVILEVNAFTFAAHGSRRGSTEIEAAFAAEARRQGAYIAVSSDAHYHDTVGVFDGALDVVEALDYPAELIVNRDAEAVLVHLLARRERPRLLDVSTHVRAEATRQRAVWAEAGLPVAQRAIDAEVPGW